MADACLEDFFAKKDKSKRKNKASKTKVTADDLPTTGGTTAADPNTLVEFKKEKKKKKKDSDENSGEKKDDAEWIDFEDVNDTDYTGLRIQNLVISKEEEPELVNEDEYEEGEDGERILREKESGPWNSNYQATVAEEIVAPSAPAAKIEEVAPSGRYVPPAARLAASQGSQVSGGRPQRRGKKGAPQINSKLEFPTLGGSMEECNIKEKEYYGSNRYEPVKGGNRQTTENNRTVQVELGNKFQALTKND